MEDIPSFLSASILPEYEIILVKCNYAVEEYEDGMSEPPDNLGAAVSYIRDNKIDIVYSSAGIHLNGEHKKPHCHWHMIVKSLPTGSFRSNQSLHRKRWLAKEGNEHFSFDNVSFSFPKKLEPVWQTLAYPYKEGIECKSSAYPELKVGMTKPIKNFLMEYGSNIYQVALGKNAKQDAYENRKKVALIEMLNFCKENRDRFKTFREMLELLEDDYLAKMSPEQKPKFNNYKENCYVVGNTLGIFRYCDKIKKKNI